MIYRYFNNLAEAAANEKAVLEKLAKINLSLRDSTAELTAMVAKLTGENRTLQ